jgi:uncharacterized protein with HEPN domain
MLDETTYIMTSSASLDKTKFVQDAMLKRAYVRSIEVIGEAVICGAGKLERSLRHYLSTNSQLMGYYSPVCFFI